ncbi:Alpha/Beta hydrolase protein [Obelidium mucronatum]|nr:Alpha/Beta hydrolase protein [Obelidium mucronatum]
MRTFQLLCLALGTLATPPSFILHPPASNAKQAESHTPRPPTRLRLASVFEASVFNADAGLGGPHYFSNDASSTPTFEMLGTRFSPFIDAMADPRVVSLRMRDLERDHPGVYAQGEVFEVNAIPGAVPVWSKASKRALRSSKTKNSVVDVYHKDMLLPNASDPTTVLALGRITSTSYAEPGGKGWIDVPPYNLSDRFGWTSDGIRGYVFADDSRDMLVIALKGTSLSVPIVGGGPTAPRDKFNDNMMFSCCCGKVSSSWQPVCDCADSGTSTCDMSCLYNSASFSNSYFNLANTIYMAVSLWYPASKTIWLTGHSLGGSLASLVGLTHDLPVLAYEAPGDFMYALRIGLIPDDGPRHIPDYTSFLASLQTYHIGNWKDPIYMGECVTSGSLCWIVGYALESKCHAGYKCVYEGNGPALDINYHSIDRVISEFLVQWDHVPECKVQPQCDECGAWTWKEAS